MTNKGVPGKREYSRRNFLTGIAASAAAGSLVGSGRRARAESVNEDDALAYFDLSYVHDYDLNDPEQLNRAYDHMHLVFTLQGLVNRASPRLWVNFVVRNQFGPLAVDEFWFDLLRQPGQLLADRRVDHIPDLEALIQRFGEQVRGAVIWDPSVPATSNVATTVAGADDLVAMRYDPTPGSVYQQYAMAVFPPMVWLIRPNGRPLFTGQGRIPGTNLPSSGSAKCDAYLWATARYLERGKSNTQELAYYLDSYWREAWPRGLEHNTPNPANQALLCNHDFLVANRGFVFDLHVFADEAPIDDPDQEPGTDLQTLTQILRSAFERNAGGMGAISGFTPWMYKYTSTVGGRHHPVASEWRFVELATEHNFYVEADALSFDMMANASVFQHGPVEDFNPQNPRITPLDVEKLEDVAQSEVAPKRYIMYYTGDYDSPAWMYNMYPIFWESADRGKIPLNWVQNPNLAKRLPIGFTYTRDTRTNNDTFIAGDSGAGYVNPGLLEAPRRHGFPDALDAWVEHCSKLYRQWDISITGFILDGLAPTLSPEGLSRYGEFSPDGIATMKIPSRDGRQADVGVVDGIPVIRQFDIPRIAPPQAAQALTGALRGDLDRPPPAPQFYVGRSVAVGPDWHIQVADIVRGENPNAAIDFIDASSFFALLRYDLDDRTTTFPLRTLTVDGESVPVVFEVLNARSVDADVSVRLDAPELWRVEPSEVTVTVPAGQYTTVTFNVEAPSGFAGRAPGAVIADDGEEERRREFDFVGVDRSLHGAEAVSVELGAEDRSEGLLRVEQGTLWARSEVAELGGRECRVIAPFNHGFGDATFLYFRADPTYALAPDGQRFTVTVEYFDAPGQRFGLEYDAVDRDRFYDGVHTDAGSVDTQGSQTWRTHTFVLDEARMTKRQTGSPDARGEGIGDFRIHSSQRIGLSKIEVHRAS